MKKFSEETPVEGQHVVVFKLGDEVFSGDYTFEGGMWGVQDRSLDELQNAVWMPMPVLTAEGKVVKTDCLGCAQAVCDECGPVEVKPEAERMAHWLMENRWITVEDFQRAKVAIYGEEMAR